jgi:hypothetical protein
MAASLHTLTAEALALDPADRLRLASELIDSVEGPTDPEWRAQWTAEVQGRTAAADARAARGEPRGRVWSEVKKRLLDELEGR